MNESPADRTPDAGESDRFISKHSLILQRGQVIARAISKTMAKRIANALNRYKPNREGV